MKPDLMKVPQVKLRMIKKYIIAGLVLAAIFFAAAVYLMLAGPRMEYQYKIKTYESLFTPLAEGSVPVEIKGILPPNNAVNPVAMRSEALDSGKIYYDYYCVFCHGHNGFGDGQVGQSYYPKPADLHAAKIKSYSDGALYRAMLTGVGHEPVLERVVLERCRWYIVLYVRSLSGAENKQSRKK
ncbi:MAG TPA: hypothetical protein VHO03_04445 [Ignavibacteriales bacterium]|nr:hypothetical protein [Ignavibacteriales bacterium]